MKALRMKHFSAVLVLAALALTGCGSKKKTYQPPAPEPTTPAPTASITATPQTVDKGDAVVVVWRTTDATDVALDGVGAVKPNDQLMLAPTETTTYHIVAKGDGGDAEASVTVTVNPSSAAPPPPPAAASTDTSATDEQAFHDNVKDIFFDYDSYDIRPDAQSSIPTAVSWLNAHPNYKIVIGGYCDDRGSTEYNIALGENRANAAKTAMVKAGIDASRIRIVSYGKEKQFCTEEAESCWQQNRRAAFQIDK
jgi:peptidoglycan-associated lipoprotein